MDKRRASVLSTLGVERYSARAKRSDACDERGSLAHLGATDETIAAFGWDELATTVAACTRCALSATRTNTVFGVGDQRARWFVVGEAPGADEDAKGEPFVGRGGQLLTSVLRAAGLSRKQVFIANVLKCRPPENRNPTPDEVRCCKPYLERQIALVKPSLIFCVGQIAAQSLLGVDTPISKLRGAVHEYGPDKIPTVITYHPAYLLRSPRNKQKTWDDLRFAMGVAGGVGA